MLLTPYECHERIDYFGLEKPYIVASNLERAWYKRRGILNPETVAQHQISAALLCIKFREEITRLWLNIQIIQDTLLIHDIAEPDVRVTDRTPHDIYDPHQHRRNEEAVIKEILRNNPRLVELWLDYEDGRTPEWKFSMEIDKLQAIERSRFYQDQYDIPWLTEEFFIYSAVQKKQIITPFLYLYAVELFDNKPR